MEAARAKIEQCRLKDLLGMTVRTPVQSCFTGRDDAAVAQASAMSAVSGKGMSTMIPR
jgi:hypothetical protein